MDKVLRVLIIALSFSFLSICFANDVAITHLRPPEPVAMKCLSDLLVVNGLRSAWSYQVAGDSDVLILIERKDKNPIGLFHVFTSAGYSDVVLPLSKRDKRQLTVDVSNSQKNYRLVLNFKKGKIQSESTGESTPITTDVDVTVSEWHPLDASSWAVINNFVRNSLPHIFALHERARIFAQQKYRKGYAQVPQSYEDAYQNCVPLGAYQKELGAFATDEYVKLEKRKAEPLLLPERSVTKRSDHPEWFRCASSVDCTMAYGPCGWADVVSSASKGPYLKWAKNRGEQINCDAPPDADDIQIECLDQRCVSVNAEEKASWFTCKTTSDCANGDACTPTLNKEAFKQNGPATWAWFKTVDQWENCPDEQTATSKRAECFANKCVVK
jgi:hypothetical protein